MEVPQKGLSPEQLTKAFKDHIKNNYTRVDKKTYFCNKCDSQIQQTTCYVSIHNKKFSGCVGEGKVEKIPLPYCPKCEGEPKNTSTCMHV